MSPVRTIGKYEIEQERATGGGGTVYAARDSTTGARVALKLIRGLGSAEMARFRREAGTLAQLRHPGVVRYIDHGQTDEGAAFLVMEWLEGEDLRRYLARGLLSLHEAAVLGQRVAEALAALHAHRVIHRDVKPGNIFLPGGDIAQATLVDFGLVRAEHSGFDTDVTATGVVVGTPAYMAPEQARGLRGIDTRADLFALGCVLYRCLAGRAAFDGKHIVAVLTKVILEQPAPLRELRPDVPGPFADLVARLLEKDPDRRPASALVVAKVLAQLVPLTEEVPHRDHEDSEAPPSSRSGLTTNELRVASVLMVGTPEGGDAEHQRLRQVADAHAGRVHALRGGTYVITGEGDAILSDQATRVAEIALALREVLPSAAMAIATGRAEVGRAQVMGDALERAAHLLDACAAAEIAVDDVSAALLDARFELRGEGETRALVGGRSSETPARTVLGRVTPMLGREWEMRSLETFFRDVVEDPGARPILVTGAAGMGKSRLAHEAVGALRRRHPQLEVWWARGDPLRSGSAMSVVGQLVRSAANIRESDPPETRTQRILALMKARVRGLDAPWISMILGELAGAPIPGEASLALRAARADPQVMGEQIATVFHALVDATCGAGPLVMVLNDVQWVDAATVSLVGATLSSLSQQPWLVLALARPEVHEVHPGMWAEQGLQEIRLRPLTKRASIELAREVLGDAAGQDTLEQIVARADGNAFYLEELIRAVSDNKRRGAAAGPLPETVLGMVQARLARLDAEARRALRAASVFGETFWLGGVAALLGGSTPRASVDALIDRELVSPSPASRFAGETELCFRHALVREGAYAMLTDEDRRNGHALAGDWLAQHGEADALVLAAHFELGGEIERAAELLMAAASRALTVGDTETARAYAEKALSHLGPDARRLEGLGVLAEVAMWRQSWASAETRAREIVSLAEPGRAEWFRAQGYLLTVGTVSGRTALAAESIGAILGQVPIAGAEIKAVPMVAVCVLALATTGHFTAAVETSHRVERMMLAAGAATDAMARGWAELSRAWTAGFIDGDPWRARALSRSAQAIFDDARIVRDARFAGAFIGAAELDLGRLQDAEAALRPLQGSPDPVLATIASLYLTLVLTERGSFAEARVLARRLLDEAGLAERQDGALRAARARWLLAEIALGEDDLAAAETLLAESHEGAQWSPLLQHMILVTTAELRLTQGRAAEALELARDATRLLARMGGHGEQSTRNRVALAEALDAVGETDAATTVLKEAVEFLVVRARGIDDREARRSFLADKVDNARLLRLARAHGLLRAST